MAKVKMTIEVEFEATNDGAANAAAIRLKGAISRALRTGVSGFSTNVLPDSIRVDVINQSIKP